MLRLFELLFVFGSVAFWVTFAALMLIIWIFEENERFGGATILFGVTVAGLFIANPSLRATFKAYPAIIIVVAVVYVLLGVIYSVLRWKLLLTDLLTTVRDNKLTRTKARRRDGSDPFSNDVFKNEVDTEVSYRNRYVRIPPNVRDFKARIIGWMAYWPWSAAWFLINDPIKRAYRYIYESLVSYLQNMSDNTFKDYHSDKDK
jgi:hypothetical protein